MEMLGANPAHVSPEAEQRPQIRWSEGRRIRRYHAENWSDRHRHVMHQLSEAHRRLGIARRMPFQLRAVFVRVAPAAEVVPVVERCNSALERQNLEAVP